MSYNIQQLEDRIASLPDEIYQQSKKAVQAKEDAEMAKLEYEAATADSLLTVEKANATEKKAHALVVNKPLKEAWIKAQTAYEKVEILHKAKSDEFTALRKVASLEQEAMKLGVSGN